MPFHFPIILKGFEILHKNMAQFAGNGDPAIQKIVQVVQCLEVLLRHNNDYSDYKLLLRKYLVYLKI